MGREEPDEFEFGDLRGPLGRVRQVENQHSLWQKDSHGDEHFNWRESFARTAHQAMYASPTLMPLAMWEDRKRFARIGKALSKAYAPTLRILGAETDSVLLGVLEGMLPMLEQLAEAVGIGALLGGAVGALGGPADELTVPGGAMAGAELALWITGALGIKELLGNGLKNLGAFASLAKDGVELAWWAGDDPKVDEARDLNDAAQLFAMAMAELWLVLLSAIIVWVMHRAGQIASESLGKIAGSAAFKQAMGEMRGKAGKLGSGFGDWFEKNFENIRRDVGEREKALRKVEGESGGETESTGGGASPVGSSSSSSTAGPTTKTYLDGSVRTPDGKFAGKTGVVPGTPGVAKAEGIINNRPGWRVVGKEISVRDADGTLRRYDLVAQNPEGDFVGIEVKSGSASLTPQQRDFDANLNASGGMDTVGQRAVDAGVDRIARTELVRVP